MNFINCISCIRNSNEAKFIDTAFLITVGNTKTKSVGLDFKSFLNLVSINNVFLKFVFFKGFIIPATYSCENTGLTGNSV